MKILGLESSAKSASVALMEDGKLLARSFQNTGLTHSRTLLPMAEAMLQNCELGIADVDAVAVAVGPGSFTGLRIGISAAKGLAWARELPCIGVSTLEAMAQKPGPSGKYGAGVRHGRPAQPVYNALFLAESGTLQRLCPDRAVSLAAVAEDLRREHRAKIVVGDGAVLCYNALKDAGVSCALAQEALRMQDAVGVCQCAEAAARTGLFTAAQDLQPVYLRLSQAERERLAKEQQRTSLQ